MFWIFAKVGLEASSGSVYGNCWRLGRLVVRLRAGNPAEFANGCFSCESSQMRISLNIHFG